jgi:ABC-type glycerol-3-phosphate transport system substrate-binding protein
MAENDEKKQKISRRDFLRTVTAGSAGAALAAAGIPVVDPIRGRRLNQETTLVTVFINGNLLTEADSVIEAQMFTIHLNEYNLQNKGIIARYQGVSRTDYETKVRLQTAAGEIDNTVIWSGFAGIHGFVLDKVVQPLDELMAKAGVKLSEWLEPVQNHIRYNPDAKRYGEGPVWGLPLWAHAGFAFNIYNEDVLKEAGASAPTAEMNWKQVAEIAEKIADPAKGRWGIAWNPYGDRHDIGVELLYVAPFGGYVLSEDGKQCLLNSPEAVEGYAFYNEMVNVKKLSPRRVDQDAFGSYPGGAQKGVLPIYRMGGWGANWYLQRPENKAPAMGIAVQPSSFDGRKNGRRGNLMGIDWYGVSAKATKADAVFDVLYWLTNKRAGEFQIDTGAVNPAPRPDVFQYEGLKKNLVASMNVAALPGVDRPPRTANARDAEINTLIQQRFQPVDNGEQTPDKAWLDKLTGEIQAILDKPPVSA